MVIDKKRTTSAVPGPGIIWREPLIIKSGSGPDLNNSSTPFRASSNMREAIAVKKKSFKLCSVKKCSRVVQKRATNGEVQNEAP
eukprot:1532985-Amphidinium_carterae.1